MNCEEKPVLQVKNLTVRYGKGCPQCQTHLEKNRCTVCGTVWAANDVSVEVYPGEVLGIVGESGSGKSTLMQSLYFDIAPTSGEAYLQDYKDGKESIWLASAAEQRHIKNCIMGMVYQNPVRGLRMQYSAASNIAEKLIAAGNRSAGHMTERAKELLQAVEILTSRMGEAPKNFSGGMQQRVQISKALANNPSLLLLDEVTTGLDLSVQAKVLDLIRQIKARYGISILLVSHDLAVIRMLADRTVVMLDGVSSRKMRRGRSPQTAATLPVQPDPWETASPGTSWTPDKTPAHGAARSPPYCGEIRCRTSRMLQNNR